MSPRGRSRSTEVELRRRQHALQLQQGQRARHASDTRPASFRHRILPTAIGLPPHRSNPTTRRSPMKRFTLLLTVTASALLAAATIAVGPAAASSTLPTLSLKITNTSIAVGGSSTYST